MNTKINKKERTKLQQQITAIDKQIEQMKILIKDTMLDIEDRKNEKKLIFKQLTANYYEPKN